MGARTHCDMNKLLVLMLSVLLAFVAACFAATKARAGNHDGQEKYPGQKSRPPRRDSSAIRVQAEMKNIDLRIDTTIILHIRTLRGEFVNTRKGVPPTFDDKRSFVVKIDSGVISISAAHLADLMNRYVFAYRGSPLRKVKMSTEGNRIKQSGILHKGVDIPFEAEGELGTTPEGEIRFHPTSVKSAHIPVKGFMDLFGVKIANLINVNGARGVNVEKDDFILSPAGMFPPPRIQGRISAVTVEGDQIVQTFGRSSSQEQKAFSPPHPEAPNYMYFRGGILRFGKLTMTDADLQLVDCQSE
jgi:hypothetical protein